MIFNVQEFYLLLLIWTPIIGPALIPFVIRKKYESIKGYSVFSIFTLLYCLIPSVIFLGYILRIVSSGGPEEIVLIFMLLPVTTLISIILGIISILEIKRKKIKGLNLIIIGIIATIFPIIMSFIMPPSWF